MNSGIDRQVNILCRQFQIYVNNALKPFGVSSSECPVLMGAAIEEGVSQEELTRRIRIDKSATARALQSLEKKGFIERREDPEDRRVKRVYLTADGRLIAEKMRQVIGEWTRSITCGQDEETIRLVENTLRQMNSRALSLNGLDERALAERAAASCGSS